MILASRSETRIRKVDIRYLLSKIEKSESLPVMLLWAWGQGICMKSWEWNYRIRSFCSFCVAWPEGETVRYLSSNSCICHFLPVCLCPVPSMVAGVSAVYLLSIRALGTDRPVKIQPLRSVSISTPGHPSTAPVLQQTITKCQTLLFTVWSQQPGWARLEPRATCHHPVLYYGQQMSFQYLLVQPKQTEGKCFFKKTWLAWSASACSASGNTRLSIYLTFNAIS